MKRFVSPLARPGKAPIHRRGFTIIELMMATLLTLMLMLIVVGLFAAVSEGIRNSRATMEMAGRLRATKRKLQLDLEGRTVIVSPPARPAAGEGYLEIIEGPLGPIDPPVPMPVNLDTGLVDTTVADFDDILMLTTRSRAGPFVGRYQGGTIQSYEAEVVWFVRARTLYRRVLLIAPQMMSPPAGGSWSTTRYLDNNYDSDMTSDPMDDPTDGNGVVDMVDTGNESFYALYDISARPEYDVSERIAGWVPNTLGDLTKRENRFAHAVHPTEVTPLAPATILNFPYPASRWWNPASPRWWQLGMPTLRECADPNWMSWADPASMPVVTLQTNIDLWASAAQAHPWPETDARTGTLLAYPGAGVNSRVAEDVILTNVIGFDVKVWDPGAPRLRYQGRIIQPGDPGFAVAAAAGAPIDHPRYGAYVDLGYYPGYVAAPNAPTPHFNGLGFRALDLPMVYDTWSFHYEHDGIDQGNLPMIDEGTNGFDDDGNGIIDDLGEREAIAPYPVPLRGVQIKIRTFEPDSRQVREVTVVADFSPK
ncbi:MAG: hypothetical protein ABIK89_14515 [Planctomycetota bacterium]